MTHDPIPDSPPTPVTPIPILDRPRTFWSLQAVVWLLFGVVYYLAMLPRVTFSPLFLLGGKAIWAVTGLGVSSVLAVMYRTMTRRSNRVGPMVAMAFAACLVLGPLWIFGLGTMLTLTLGSNVLYDDASFPYVAVNHCFVLLAWTGGYLAVTFWDRARIRERDLVEASRLAQEAQLAMLRYQLNPHFLFNAMTSVRALVTADPTGAREMITRLSEFLRYTLDQPQRTTATVEEEFAAMQHYLSIETVRFDERLAVKVRLDPDVQHLQVPSFILHPLVENAIRHGEADESGRFCMEIEGGSVNGSLRLRVSNTGRLREPREAFGLDRSHVGLRNVRERLGVSFPDEHEFTVKQDGDWVRATITLPAGRS